MTKNNLNPLPTRIGVIFLFLSIIIYFINRKITTNFNLELIGSIIFFAGFILMAYGLTKIDVEGDKAYQKYIRLSSKILLVVVLSVLVLGMIGAAIGGFPSSFFPILLIVGMIVGIFFVINDWIFYLMTYKYVKKVGSKMTPEQKRKQILLGIICIILGMALWYVTKILE